MKPWLEFWSKDKNSELFTCWYCSAWTLSAASSFKEFVSYTSENIFSFGLNIGSELCLVQLTILGFGVTLELFPSNIVKNLIRRPK